MEIIRFEGFQLFYVSHGELRNILFCFPEILIFGEILIFDGHLDSTTLHTVPSEDFLVNDTSVVLHSLKQIPLIHLPLFELNFIV